MGFAPLSCVEPPLCCQVLNFGFSGNGKMELEVAQFLTQVPTPSVFIVDCVWNMDAALITNNTVPLVHYVRRWVVLRGGGSVLRWLLV